MSFTKVAPAGIGTEPGTSILIGDSLLHSTGIDIGSNTGIGVTIRKHGDATFTGIVTAASFSGSGANLTGIDATAIKHTDGSVKAQAVATGVNVTGNLGVSGVLTYEDVTNIDSVGVITARSGIKIGPTAGVAATIFSDGSINTTGIVTATTIKVGTAISITDSAVSATRFHGDGSQLTGITGTTINSNADNRVITGSGTANTLNGESGLTFDGSVLSVTGRLTSLMSGANTFTVGSSNAGGAYFVLDGDSNGDGTGADYSGMSHESDGNLTIYQDNPNANGQINFMTGGAQRVSIQSDKFRPSNDNAMTLGTSGLSWGSIYTKGNVVIGTSGAGIDFSAHGNTSSCLLYTSPSPRD